MTDELDHVRTRCTSGQLGVKVLESPSLMVREEKRESLNNARTMVVDFTDLDLVDCHIPHALGSAARSCCKVIDEEVLLASICEQVAELGGLLGGMVVVVVDGLQRG